MGGDRIPKWLSRKLNLEQLQTLSKKIREIEADTNAEVVTMIVERSSATSHLPWLLFFPALAINLGVHWWLEIQGLWSFGWLSFGLSSTLLLAISMSLSFSHFVSRLLIRNDDEIEQVERRAIAEFHLKGVHKTKARNGLFLFVSLLEQRVVVLADQGLAKGLPPETWKQIVDVFLKPVRQGQIFEGFQSALETSHQVLKKKGFGQGDNHHVDDDANELTDHLIIEN